jgi:hypothetical protein
MGAAPRPRSYDRVIHLAGAAASALLLVGALWWGYQLAVRDVSGVPVMRAMAGAMRVAPADPGGDVAGHQGLSVNAVAAAGTAAPLPQELILAPAAQGLSAEDAAGLALPTVVLAPEGTFPEVSALNETGFSAGEVLAATEIPTTDQSAVAAALAEALSDPVDGSAALAAAETAAPQVQTVSSMRPKVRPSRDAAATDAALQSGAQSDPDSVVAGTRLAQLGAFDDSAAATSEWSRLAARFPELMATKSMVVQPALSGGRTFFRLRALGFAGDDEARRFCTALLAENATCIPVIQR